MRNGLREEFAATLPAATTGIIEYNPVHIMLTVNLTFGCGIICITSPFASRHPEYISPQMLILRVAMIAFVKTEQQVPFVLRNFSWVQQVKLDLSHSKKLCSLAEELAQSVRFPSDAIQLGSS